jgi:hypothetical protein
MYWHNKDIQIAVSCDLILHAVADTYTFLGNPLPPHSGSLTQKIPFSSVVGGLRVIKKFPKFMEPSLPGSQGAD